jgi:hypothetical protein
MNPATEVLFFHWMIDSARAMRPSLWKSQVPESPIFENDKSGELP